MGFSLPAASPSTHPVSPQPLLTVGSCRDDHCTLRKLMLSLLWLSFSKLFLNSVVVEGHGITSASQDPMSFLGPLSSPLGPPTAIPALTFQAGRIELDEKLGTTGCLHDGLYALKLDVCLL